MNPMNKQNLIEIHTENGRKSIAKVMNTQGHYIYTIHTSELCFSLFDIEKSTFHSWNHAWDYFKKTTERWYCAVPAFVNQDIRNIIKSELKQCIYDFTIAEYNEWKGEQLRVWESCLKQEIKLISREEWLRRAG